MISVMMRKYEYCLDTCSLYVSGDTYIREKKFRWMEMGIVVKIHVPIQGRGGRGGWVGGSSWGLLFISQIIKDD
jgi:hypothetical protein